ncbi:MAG: hypothetical protein WCP38_00225 [Chloroflexota bacterium]
MPNERPRKGRPLHVGSLIPDAARALGFEAELELSQQAHVLTDVLQKLAPHLAMRCRMIGRERGQLIVEADDRAAAQELHLRGAEVAGAYTEHSAGVRTLGLSVRLANSSDNPRENE